jgi:hypothetical protein
MSILHAVNAIKLINDNSYKTIKPTAYRATVVGCVFLHNYYLLINKKYLTYIKQHLKSLNLCTTAVAMATMTFQDDGYFGFKVI